MHLRIRNTPMLDALRAIVAGWVLGRKQWSRLYRFHTEAAWEMGRTGQPLPWKREEEAALAGAREQDTA